MIYLSIAYVDTVTATDDRDYKRRTDSDVWSSSKRRTYWDNNRESPKIIGFFFNVKIRRACKNYYVKRRNSVLCVVLVLA